MTRFFSRGNKLKLGDTYFFTRLRRLQSRDRKALLILGAVLVPVILWQTVWMPVEAAYDDAQTRYTSASTDLLWMQAHSSQIGIIGSAGKTANDKPLLAVVSDAAQICQLVLNRAEPGDKGTLRISLDNVNFNHVLAWLELLRHEHGIQAVQINIERQTTPGFVNATLILQSS